MQELPKITPTSQPPAPHFKWPFLVVFVVSWLLSLGGMISIRALDVANADLPYPLNQLVLFAIGAVVAFPNGCGLFLAFSPIRFKWRIALITGAILISSITPELMNERPFTSTPIFDDTLEILLPICLQLLIVVGVLFSGRLFWKWRFRQGDEIEPAPRLAIWHLFVVTAVVAALLAIVQFFESQNDDDGSPSGAIWFAMLWVGGVPAMIALVHQIIGLWTILRFRSLVWAVAFSVLPIAILVAALGLFIFYATKPGFLWNPDQVAEAVVWFFAGYTTTAFLPHFILRFFGKRLVAGA